MTLIPELRQELCDTAARRAQATSAGRSWRRSGWLRARGRSPEGSAANGRPHRRRASLARAPRVGVAPILLAVSGIVVVGVVAVALSIHSASRHPNASKPPNHVLSAVPQPLQPGNGYIKAAFAAARRQDPSCSAVPPPTPRTWQGSPGAAILATLGVLRRSASPTDSPPSQYLTGPRAGVPGVYVGDIRRARVAFGTSYYVLPAFYAGKISAQCAAGVRAQLRRELTHIHGPLKASTLEFGTRAIAGESPSQNVALLTVASNGTTNELEMSLVDIENRPYLAGDGMITYGLVPDAVANIDVATNRLLPSAAPSLPRPQSRSGRSTTCSPSSSPTYNSPADFGSPGDQPTALLSERFLSHNGRGYRAGIHSARSQ